LVGLLVTVLTVYQVTLDPPGLHPRVLTIAAASTTLLVDLHQSDITDLTPSADQLGGLATQADLLGEVMVTDPVLDDIGRLIDIPASKIQADAPVTSNVPRDIIEPDSGANAMQLIASPDQYKLQVQVDPTTPVIHIYTQAPSVAAALQLASASVQGLRDYLSQLSAARGVAPTNEIRLVELGAPTGGVVNSHAEIEIGLLAFITGFAAALFAISVFPRVRRGWRLATLEAQVPR